MPVRLLQLLIYINPVIWSTGATMARNISASSLERMAKAASRFDSHLSTIETIRSTEQDIMATADRIMGRTSPSPVRRTAPVSARRPVGAPIRAPAATSPSQPTQLQALFERSIGPTDDVVSIEFLEAGLLAKRPVGRIWNGGEGYATGFLVGHGLMMTAGHVLPSVGEASDLVFQLDYEEHNLGPSAPMCEYALDPATFFLRDPDYDVALCAVQDFARLSPPVETFGWHVLRTREETIDAGTPVSIIQHPEGRTKSLVVHNSQFIDTGKESEDERYCWYTGDTEPGSSGSPIFDLNWRLLAVHSSAVPRRAPSGSILGRDGNPILVGGREVLKVKDLQTLDGVAFLANEGLRVSRIVGCLGHHTMPSEDQETLRKKLMKLWHQPGAERIARRAIIEGLRAMPSA